jgi:hypothetical protein
VLRFRVLSLGLIVSLAAGAAPGRPRTEPEPANPSPQDEKKPGQPMPRLPAGHELMRAKLKHAQAILEGLAVSDYKMTTAAADELVRISQAVEFLNAYKSREYAVQIALFRRSAETIAQKAKDKNIDGVTLAYLDMTMTCLKCHQHTRDPKADARLPIPRTPVTGTAVK